MQNVDSIYKRQLWMEKYMEKTVYVNCIGFLKIYGDFVQELEEFDLLDSTRIHPENYCLAKKIAKDGLDDEQ